MISLLILISNLVACKQNNIPVYELSVIKSGTTLDELFDKSLIFNIDSRQTIANNNKQYIDVSIMAKPYISDEYIMIPLRFCMQQFGAKLGWDQETFETSILYKDKDIRVIREWKEQYLINSKKYNYVKSPEVVDSMIFISIEDICTFSGKEFMKVNNLLIIDESEQLDKIKTHLEQNEELVTVIKEKFSDKEEMKINWEKQINEDLGGYNWLKDGRLVAHAMGGINRLSYSNSLEAFQLNYQKGLRVFEADLIRTTDEHLVAKHDWQYFWYANFNQKPPMEVLKDKGLKEKDLTVSDLIPISRKTFKEMPIYDQYTPLDFEDIVRLMEQYDDMYLVTDTKDTTVEEIRKTFNYIVAKCNEKDSQILDRIIPQIFTEEMYDDIMNIYNFKSIIYTLYQTSSTEDEIIEFVSNNNIKVITMEEGRFNDEFINRLKEKGVFVYIHTINSIEVANKYLSKNVYGFYTDFLSE